MDRDDLRIIMHPHPTLRHPSKTVRRMDRDLRAVIREMFDLMYEAKGVGLAANQVDIPLRFFIVNLSAQPDEGEELVFINPVISRARGTAEQEEGCLSLPGVYGQVRRPKEVRVNAYNLEGQEIQADVSGMIARVIQHETDHLDGVLFIDKLADSSLAEVEGLLSEFELDYQSKRSTGGIPADEEILARLARWEEKYG